MNKDSGGGGDGGGGGGGASGGRPGPGGPLPAGALSVAVALGVLGGFVTAAQAQYRRDNEDAHATN